MSAAAGIERRSPTRITRLVLRAPAKLFAALLILLATSALTPHTALGQAPERTVRLTITEVGDSTFTFDAANLRWVKPGERGMAVDPSRRDALVARFAVLRVEHGRATAVITGATTELTRDHVVVIEVPFRPWYRSSLFWGGAVMGTLFGVLVGSI